MGLSTAVTVKKFEFKKQIKMADGRHFENG